MAMLELLLGKSFNSYGFLLHMLHILRAFSCALVCSHCIWRPPVASLCFVSEAGVIPFYEKNRDHFHNKLENLILYAKRILQTEWKRWKRTLLVSGKDTWNRTDDHTCTCELIACSAMGIYTSYSPLASLVSGLIRLYTPWTSALDVVASLFNYRRVMYYLLRKFSSQ
jgi:hypothetical protein